MWGCHGKDSSTHTAGNKALGEEASPIVSKEQYYQLRDSEIMNLESKIMRKA